MVESVRIFVSHRARRFYREAVHPWTSPQTDLAAAPHLNATYGYGRRKEELDDAKALILRKPGKGLS